MIRRDFMKLLTIAAAGLTIFQFSRPTPSVAGSQHKHQRQWLSGSPRSGCAHRPGHDLLAQ